MKVKELIKEVENDGWYLVRQSGSHQIYHHTTKTGILVVPNHGLNKDIGVGLANTILKQAGLK